MDYLKCLMIFVLTLWSSSSLAENYFKGSIGYSINGSEDAKYSTDGASLDFNESLDSVFLNPISMAYGLEISEKYFLEFEVAFGKFEYKADYDDSVSYIGLGINNIFSLNPDNEEIRPWAGIGLSLAQFSISNFDEIGANAQLMVGIDFKVGDNIYIGPDLRYLITVMAPKITTYVDEVGADVDIEAKYKQLSLNFSMKIIL